MKTKKQRKVPSYEEFESVMIGGYKGEIEYLLHRITAIVRRINRKDPVDDFEFGVLHEGIDMLLRLPPKKSIKGKV